MFLYLVSRNDTVSWDEYDSCVVVAESSTKAKLISPGNAHTWSNDLSVKCIGTASKNLLPCVIIASFNAG